jgi:uncharacterized protein YjbI with pentapeptide repeats
MALASRQLFVLIILLASALGALPQEIRLSAEEAYERLVATGTLSSVTITGPFVFGHLPVAKGEVPGGRGYRFENVEFVGPVELARLELSEALRFRDSRFRDALRFQDCRLGAFSLERSDVDGDLVVESCKIKGPASFDGSRISGQTRIHSSSFRFRPTFRDTVFGDRTELLACTFGWEGGPATMATSFSSTVFEGIALFNNSVFHHRAKFNAAVFRKDASFLNVSMMAGAVFRNVHFGDDAEFRFCRMGQVDFGDAEDRKLSGVTLFTGRADFRGCVIDGARFDYAEFRGETIFSDVRFGVGGASFRHANLGDSFSDFDGVTIAQGASLVLSNARFPALRLRWQDLGEPILAGQPDAKVLESVHRRLVAMGENEGALDASFHLAEQRFREGVAGTLPSAVEEPLGFIDAATKRVIAYGEWLLWGLTTGYGTKLGRVILLALICWLLFSIPPATAGLMLARVPVQEGKAEAAGGEAAAAPPLYEPVSSIGMEACLERPEHNSVRYVRALKFTFPLLFKVGPKRIRFVVDDPQSIDARRWQFYFATLWYLGSALLLLIALTLANTSPIIEKLVQAVLF